MNKFKSGRIDWMITLVPFILIMTLAGILFFFPEQSNDVHGNVTNSKILDVLVRKCLDCEVLE